MKDPLDSHGQPFRDSFNPDPDKRTRALLGHQLILGLKLTPEGKFDGDIYNAEDGKSYSVSIWRESPDRLKLKGCLIKFLCQTQTWQQTLDVLPGQLVGLTGDLNGPAPTRNGPPCRHQSQYRPKQNNRSIARFDPDQGVRAAFAIGWRDAQDTCAPVNRETQRRWMSSPPFLKRIQTMSRRSSRTRLRCVARNCLAMLACGRRVIVWRSPGCC
jgi:hypothetical protein